MNARQMITGIGASIALILVGLGPLRAPAAEEATEPTRETPREAMEGYLTACRAGDYELAAQYLNLARIPAARRETDGPKLARQLKTVLDQTLWVELESLSNEPGGDPDDDQPSGRDRVGTIKSERGPVDVLLVRARVTPEESVWLISSVTVARVPQLYQEFGYGPLGELLPRSMFQHYGELELWQWLGLMAVLVFAYAAGLVVASMILRVARRLVARTETKLDDRILKITSGPLAATLTIGLLYAGTLLLRLSVPAQRVMSGLCKALMVITLTWLALRIVDLITQLIEDAFHQRGETTAITIVPVARRVAKVFLVFIALLSALQNMGYNVTGLIAGLGVVGLAVALAAQKTFENFFGALSILVDRPVQRGDFCRYGDKIGIVEDIGLRSTRVRTLDRTLVTIPNSEFSVLQLENFAARDRIRFFTILGLRYETTADQLRHVLIELRRFLLSHAMVHPDPARVRFVGFGAHSLDLEIFAYVTTSDWNEFLAVREDLLLRIIDIVEGSGTGFAFPSQTLYLGKDNGLDATRSREAEEQVRRWREEHALCLPDFPESERHELGATLAYPEEGSAVR